MRSVEPKLLSTVMRGVGIVRFGPTERRHTWHLVRVDQTWGPAGRAQRPAM